MTFKAWNLKLTIEALGHQGSWPTLQNPHLDYTLQVTIPHS
jgi:hypothetical protein